MSVLYASVTDGRMINIKEYDTTVHRGRISCPVCNAPLVARCFFNVRHFTHHGGASCSDTWRPVVTKWRRAWLERWYRERVERCVDHANTKHVADVITERGNVVMFQSSGINVDALYEREDFFAVATGRLPVWMFDCAGLTAELHGKNFMVARLPHASWASARGPAFLDTPTGTYIVVAQNVARPEVVVAQPIHVKTDTVTLAAPQSSSTALPLTLKDSHVTSSRLLATDVWRKVCSHFRWNRDHHMWALHDFAGAMADSYGRASNMWLPTAPFGAPATDPRTTLRRDKALFDLLTVIIDGKCSPLGLPMGDLPKPLESLRARGVRDLTNTIFANM